MTEDELRVEIAMAIQRYDWEHGLSANGTPGVHTTGEADAVLVVVGPLLAQKDDRQKARANGLLTLLDVVHDDSPCRWDHTHSCQAHDFPDVPLGEPCPQQVIGEVLAKAKEDAAGALVCMCLPAEQVQAMRDGLPPRPVCAVHPDGGAE